MEEAKVSVIEYKSLYSSYCYKYSSREPSRMAMVIIGVNINEIYIPTGNIVADDDKDEFELALTRENVEIVLDEMRPFLQADG
jgi:hypothetical protein